MRWSPAVEAGYVIELRVPGDVVQAQKDQVIDLRLTRPSSTH
jgi:hypothetical protein